MLKEILDLKLLPGVIGDILQDKKVMLLMVDEQSRNKVREKVATHPSRKEKNSPQTRYCVLR